MTGVTQIMLALLFGGSIALFVYGLALLLSRRIASLEKKYVTDAEQSLDSMFLSLPVRGIMYLTLGAGFGLGMLGYIVSGNPLLAIILTIVGLISPRMLINNLRNRRNAKFLNQLADVLLAMSNSLKAGYSITQAINLIVRESPNPVQQEFSLVAREMQLGTSLEDALDHLAARMKSMEMDLIAASVSISRQVGGNLSEIMENIAGTIRERMRVDGQVKALTAQGKIQGIIMCLMPFALAGIIYAINPPYMRPVFTQPLGYILIGAVIAWMALGAVVIRKVTKVDI